MDKKNILSNILRNKILILSCAVLVIGCIFGVSMLKFLPEATAENLFSFASQNAETFFGSFLNRFCFPFITLLFVFLAGFSAVGKFTALAALFINGVFFGFENGINYMFSGSNYILNAAISYFTATVYFGFLLIIMSEASVFASLRLSSFLKNPSAEIPHYSAKNQTVKFITFTAIFAVFAAISAYFTPILLELL